MAIEIISCAEEEEEKEEEANKQRNCYKNFLSPIYGPENVVGVFDRVASTSSYQPRNVSGADGQILAHPTLFLAEE